MDWFFAESVDGEHLITGEDAIHITKSLRKSVGEAVTLCDSSGVEHNCLIDRIMMRAFLYTKFLKLNVRMNLLLK